MTQRSPALLFDECCEASLVASVRSAGFDAAYVLESSPGQSDDQVLARATSEKRALVTDDKDFGELVVRRNLASCGIVLIRMPPGDSPSKAARLIKLLRQYGERLANSYTVVQTDRFRFRGLR